MVANRTSNAVAITDRDGLVDWVNEGFERLTGYALSDPRPRGEDPGPLRPAGRAPRPTPR